MVKRKSPPSDSNSNDVLRHPTVKRAKEIDADPPFANLAFALAPQKTDHKTRNVLYWFRSKDLRIQDNHALSAASSLAKNDSGTLITAYLFTPADMEWHGTSPARTDFILESLKLLQSELEDKNIPLAILTAEKRNGEMGTVTKFIQENDISHVFANFEYEIDELRRDIKVLNAVEKEEEVSFQVLHDQTVITPGEICGGNGPMKVFTPYHKAWCAEMAKGKEKYLSPYPDPEGNHASVKWKFKSLFGNAIPKLPESKSYKEYDADRERIRKLWPAGHAAGMARLNDFLKHKIEKYADTRSNPGKDSSSRLSPYLSAGIISPREAVLACSQHRNHGFNFLSGESAGVNSWVREIVFREFYRQVLVGKPSDGMNMPHNLKFDYVKWEDNEEHWEAWCEGKTGMPLVDAGMRQLKEEAWMHNRARMNTASYLRTNLLLDYRRGERWFAEHLVDWDLSNNTQGWEPSYTVFNPVSQAERNDPDGEYIRRWVPELKGLQGKAVFDPHGRLSKEEFEKLGYPRPIVDWVETKRRAVEVFKRDLHSHD